MPQSVADRYEIVRPLGEGGMGVVYDAVHTSTGRNVALKLLNVQGMNLTDETFARFAREARAAGAISSRHIVQVLDAGTDPKTGAPFLVMERLQGDDLRTTLKPLGLIPVGLALRIVAQACAGLAKAHEAGVVHRDIKLGNLFLAETDDDEMIVKILDFGIAKIVTAEMQEGDHELTRTGTMIGSPQYMSPEQALGNKDVDARSDLWSLGVVLYRLLAGRTPHQDTQAMGELIVNICSKPAPPLQDFAPWVPAEVARVVHRALRLRREDRYASAEAMLADVRALLPDGTSIRRSMLVPLSSEGRAATAARADLTPDPAAVDAVKTVDYRAATTHQGAESLATVELRRGTSDAMTGDVGVTIFAPDRAPRRKSRIAVGLLALAAGALFGALALARTGTLLRRAPEPPPPATAASATATLEAPKTSTVEVAVPSAAVVMVDGEVAQNAGGSVEIRGVVGSRHHVVLRVNDATVESDVVITQDGAFPSSISGPSSPPPRGVSVGAPPKDAPVRRPSTPGSQGGRTSPARPPAGSPPPGIKIQKSFE